MGPSPTRLERALLALSSLAVFLMVTLVVVTILSRFFLSKNLIPDDVLLVQELMMMLVILPFAFVTAEREHIKVDLFTRNAGPSVRRVLDVIASVCGLLMATFLTIGAVNGTLTKWRAGSVYDSDMNVLEWPGRAIMAIGLFVFALRWAWLLYASLKRDPSLEIGA